MLKFNVNTLKSCLKSMYISLHYHVLVHVYLVIIGCTVNDVTYPYGERFTAEDGCNTW